MPSATTTGAPPPTRKEKLMLFGVLGVIVAAGYGLVADSYFVADDFNILNIVSTAHSLRDATGITAGWEFFRPLTAVTYWGTFLLFGPEPLAFHVFDLVCHALNSWLVAGIAFRVVPSRIGAAAAGCLFAAMPTGAECVTWIAGRFDVLCVTGTLLAVLWWIDYLRSRRIGAMVLACCGLVLGLLAKDTGMIIPVFLVFLSVAPLRTGGDTGRSLRRPPPAILVAIVIFAIYFCVRLSVLGGFGGYKDASGSMHLRLQPGVAFDFVCAALRSMLAPGVNAVQSVASLLLVASLWIFRGDRLALLGRTWPLLVCVGIALAPAANTIWLNVETGENSRFLYLPSAFLCVALGAALGSACRRVVHRPLVTVTALLLCSFGFSLVRTNLYWREAGQQAAQVLAQLRTILARRHYEYLFIHDLPNTHHGAYVFRNGFENALRMFVSETIVFPPHGRVSRADWERYSKERRADPEAYPRFLLLRWLPEERRLVEP